MASSFGPINPNHRKKAYGSCSYCREENWTRQTGSYFESRVHMVGPVCKHRLLKPKRVSRQHKINALYQLWREEGHEAGNYWYRRALLPDYCGEPGELRIGFIPPFESWYQDQGLGIREANNG